MDITRWSIPKSDWLHSLQPKMEKFYRVSKNKTGSCLWLRSWTSYCQIQKGVYPSLYVGEAVRSGRGGALSDPPHPVGPGQPRASPIWASLELGDPGAPGTSMLSGRVTAPRHPRPAGLPRGFDIQPMWSGSEKMKHSQNVELFLLFIIRNRLRDWKRGTEGIGSLRPFFCCYQMRLNTPIWSNSLLR